MKFLCNTCPVCRYAQNNPETIIGRVWRWHTRWCPVWKAYQKKQGEEKTDNRAGMGTDGEASREENREEFS